MPCNDKSFIGGATIFFNGNYISVTSCGRGENLLLLHGFMSNKESFYYQINYFKDYFTITAPDILGFGASSPLFAPYSVDDYADWLDGFLRASNINCPYILAHSFGARVAIKYLSKNNCGAKKLVLCGGAGVVKPRSPRYIVRVKLYKKLKKFFPKFCERHFGSKEYRTLSPISRESYKKIVNEDLRESAKKITVPTLLVYGKDDRVTPASEEGCIFNNAIEGSRLVTMDGGHFCFCEHYDTFNKIVLGFLKE